MGRRRYKDNKPVKQVVIKPAAQWPTEQHIPKDAFAALVRIAARGRTKLEERKTS